jgi:hypothetical protein
LFARREERRPPIVGEFTVFSRQDRPPFAGSGITARNDDRAVSAKPHDDPDARRCAPERTIIAVWSAFNRPNGRGYDIHPDGRRVAASGGRQADGGPRQDKAVFVFNFFDELRRIAPATRE